MRAKTAVLIVLVFACFVVAQDPPPTPPPAPAPTPQPSPSPDTGRPPTPGQPTQPRFPTDDPMRDPFGRGAGRGITGKIVPSPSMRLRVDLYQDSIRLDTSYTDMDGTFRFERQQPGRRYEIRIDIGPGVEYVEEVDFSFNYPVMIHIQNRGIRKAEFSVERSKSGAGSGTIVSLASLSVPKNAAKEFEKGQKARSKKKFDEALQSLQKAVELYPKYAEAFNEIGLVHRQQNQPDEARKAFEQAINADPDWIGAYLQLAHLQLSANQPEQLLETSNKLLRLNPAMAQTHFFHSVANFSLGRLEDAEKSALEADRQDHAQLPQIHLVLARIYQNKGSNAEAAKQLRAFLKESPKAPNAEKVRAELQQLEKNK